MNRIASIESAEIIFNQDGVLGRQLLKQENTEYVFLGFEKDAQTQPHVQDILMSFFIVKGKATVLVDNEKISLKKGQMIEIEAGKSRQWINAGDDVLELFVVKTLKWHIHEVDVKKS